MHYQPAWRNGDEVRKIENGGDPQLMVCTNAEIDSGSTGISCHNHANSIPIWTNSTLLLVYSDVPIPTPMFLLPTLMFLLPTPTPTSSLSVLLLPLLQVHTPFPSVTYLSVCHPPSYLPLPCVSSFSCDTEATQGWHQGQTTTQRL